MTDQRPDSGSTADLPSAPRLFGGIRPLTRAGALRDALAGVSLASMNIPQVLGYTRIAETPVVTGLYTVLLPVAASCFVMIVAQSTATARVFGSLHEALAVAQGEAQGERVRETKMLGGKPDES